MSTKARSKKLAFPAYMALGKDGTARSKICSSEDQARRGAAGFARLLGEIETEIIVLASDDDVTKRCMGPVFELLDRVVARTSVEVERYLEANPPGDLDALLADPGKPS